MAKSFLLEDSHSQKAGDGNIPREFQQNPLATATAQAYAIRLYLGRDLVAWVWFFRMDRASFEAHLDE